MHQSVFRQRSRLSRNSSQDPPIDPDIRRYAYRIPRLRIKRGDEDVEEEDEGKIDEYPVSNSVEFNTGAEPSSSCVQQFVAPGSVSNKTAAVSSQQSFAAANAVADQINARIDQLSKYVTYRAESSSTLPPCSLIVCIIKDLSVYRQLEQLEKRMADDVGLIVKLLQQNQSRCEGQRVAESDVRNLVIDETLHQKAHIEHANEAHSSPCLYTVLELDPESNSARKLPTQKSLDSARLSSVALHFTVVPNH